MYNDGTKVAVASDLQYFPFDVLIMAAVMASRADDLDYCNRLCAAFPELVQNLDEYFRKP